MSLVLGIDTGGTYTDGVLVDREKHKIISKAKSLTTRENLAIGITDVIKKMALAEGAKIRTFPPARYAISAVAMI